MCSNKGKAEFVSSTYTCTPLETIWRISLNVADDAIEKLYVT